MRKTASSRICKQPLIKRERGEGEQGQKRWDEDAKVKLKPPVSYTNVRWDGSENPRSGFPWRGQSQIKPSYRNLPPCTRTNPQTGPKSSLEDPGPTDHFPIITCHGGALLPAVPTPLGSGARSHLKALHSRLYWTTVTKKSNRSQKGLVGLVEHVSHGWEIVTLPPEVFLEHLEDLEHTHSCPTSHHSGSPSTRRIDPRKWRPVRLPLTPSAPHGSHISLLPHSLRNEAQ